MSWWWSVVSGAIVVAGVIRDTAIIWRCLIECIFACWVGCRGVVCFHICVWNDHTHTATTATPRISKVNAVPTAMQPPLDRSCAYISLLILSPQPSLLPTTAVFSPQQHAELKKAVANWLDVPLEGECAKEKRSQRQREIPNTRDQKEREVPKARDKRTREASKTRGGESAQAVGVSDIDDLEVGVVGLSRRKIDIQLSI